MVSDGRSDGHGLAMGFAVGLAIGVVHRHVSDGETEALPSGRFGRIVVAWAWTPVVVAVDRTLEGPVARLAFAAGVICGAAIRRICD